MKTALGTLLCLLALLAAPTHAAEGLDSPRSLDSVSQEPGSFVLGLNVGDNWKDHARTFARIDAKVQGYLDFVARGPINKVNPQKKPVRVDFVLAHQPDAKARKFLEEKRKQLAAKSIGYKLVVPPDAKPSYAG